MNLQNNTKIEDLLPLKQQELDLIALIRNKYRFGSLEILVRDGLPVDLLVTVERVRLGMSTGSIDKQDK